MQAVFDTRPLVGCADYHREGRASGLWAQILDRIGERQSRTSSRSTDQWLRAVPGAWRRQSLSGSANCRLVANHSTRRRGTSLQTVLKTAGRMQHLTLSCTVGALSCQKQTLMPLTVGSLPNGRQMRG